MSAHLPYATPADLAAELAAVRLELERLQRLFRSAFHHQFQFMAILSAEGRVVDFNQQLAPGTPVPREETQKYGIVAVEDAKAKVSRITAMIEKPKPEQAPSNLHISGRYILQPTIFAHLARGEKGAGGEIQITDAMHKLAEHEPFFAARFDGAVYDCGAQLGFLLANVALALERADLGPTLHAQLATLLADGAGR